MRRLAFTAQPSELGDPVAPFVLGDATGLLEWTMTDVEARETPELRVVEREPAASLPPAQTLIDAVTQLEASKKDVSPKGFQRRLQLAYAIYDQASLMMQEIEAQHAK